MDINDSNLKVENINVTHNEKKNIVDLIIKLRMHHTDELQQSVNDEIHNRNETIIELLTKLRILEIIKYDDYTCHGMTKEEADEKYSRDKAELLQVLNDTINKYSADSYDEILTNYLLNIVSPNNQGCISELLENLKNVTNQMLGKNCTDEDTYKVLLALFSVYNMNNNKFGQIYNNFMLLGYCKPDDYTLYISELNLILGYLFEKEVLTESMAGNLIFDGASILQKVVPQKDEIYKPKTNIKITDRKNVEETQSFSSKLKIAFKKIRDFLEKMTSHKRRR